MPSMIRRLVRKLYTLPGPKELGWGSDGLRSQWLTPFQPGPSWEDWDRHVRQHYPVRYFIAETVPSKLEPIERVARAAAYFVKCHLNPRYRYHILDFRGVDPIDDYTHGYMDPCHMMWLAGWAALRRYVEREKPVDPASIWTPEQQAQDPTIQRAKATYDEAMALYRYWMVERREENAEEERLFKDAEAVKIEAVKRDDRAAFEAAQRVWLDYSQAREERGETMWMRLAALRPYLWT